MKNQIHNRLHAPFIHNVMERFCNWTIDAKTAVEILRVSQSRLYSMRTEYLQAKADGILEQWLPGRSGGNRSHALPKLTEQFLLRALHEGYNFAFAASELKRLFNLDTTRWSVRRFAIAKGMAKPELAARTPAHARRWQRLNIGELWQLDATPHHWFGPDAPAQPLYDMIDDASRLQVGIRLCRSENLADYIWFFAKSFRKHGLPLAIYVDYATFFHSPKEGNMTALAKRLDLYKVSLIFANTPQSKGKIERIHQVWQDRLPSFFRLNGITPETELPEVTPLLETLAEHRNNHETHREIGCTPRQAWDKALAEGRSTLRPVPRDAWWPYVWSVWYKKQVGKSGRVYHKDLFFQTQRLEGVRVILCEHEGGYYSVIEKLPENLAVLPVVLFTNLPENKI